MTAATTTRARRPGLTPRVKRSITAVVVLLVLVAMVFGTKVVPKGSTLGQGPAKFSAAAYGKKQFPVQVKYIQGKAVDATTLQAAIAKDATAAGKQYGVPTDGGAGPEVPVKFTGVVGKVPAAGFTPVTVAGLPKDQLVNVQLGPAINGTDLRDATGKIRLGQFENQIAYQDAASAINNRLKTVLTKAGAPDLTGKTITVTGVFQLINPKNWNVTPATIQVTQ